MPRPHIAMRRIKDVLRLSLGEELSQRRVAASLGLPRTAVKDYLQRAEAAGLKWPLPEDMDEAALEAVLFPSSATSRRPGPGELGAPGRVSPGRRRACSWPSP